MKIYRFIPILFILTSFFIGCKTTGKLSPEPQEKQAIAVPAVPTEKDPIVIPAVPREKETIVIPDSELRAIVVHPELWIDENVDIMQDNIETLMMKTAEANYNTVFLIVRNQSVIYYPSNIENTQANSSIESSGFDPINVAEESAHSNGLKIYAEVDLESLGITALEIESKLTNSSIAEMKTSAKKLIIELTENYNIDGFCFDMSRYPAKSQSIDSIEFTDLLEDIVVEAMLLKPYLLNSIICNEVQYPLALSLMEEGIVDFIVPQIDISRKESYNDFIINLNENQKKKSISGKIFPAILVNDTTSSEKIIGEWLQVYGETGGRGMVLPTGGLKESILAEGNFPYHYTSKIKFPRDLKDVKPNEIVGLNLTALFPGNHVGQKVTLNPEKRIKITDLDGNIGFVRHKLDTLFMEASNQIHIFPTRGWSIPYKYALSSENQVERISPWLEFRIMPKKFSETPDFHLLCKTDYPAKAMINSDPLKVYKTGIFFNKINFKEGPNRVRASVSTQNSESIFYEREFIYEEVDKTKKAIPLWIDSNSVKPSSNLILLPEDNVLVQFKGSLGQFGVVEVNPSGLQIGCERTDYNDYSLYRAELPMRKLETGKTYNIIVKLTASVDSSEKVSFEIPLENTIQTLNLEDFPLLKITEENSRLNYNMGPTRLGGPIREELGPGIILKSNGKIGENYRIRLDKIENGIIHQDNVEELPSETVQPPYYITNMSCAPSRGGDVVNIPYLEPIPYMVYPDPDQDRIIITMYGAKTSSTWITHHKGRKIVDKLTWKQTTPETFEVYVNLNTAKIWGYTVRRVGKRLQLYIKYPPEYNVQNRKPLTGLKIAIEAGHGGESTGAMGLSGLLEKDINLDLSLKLGNICKAMGAEIVQVRDSDKTMSLIEKRDIAQSSNADLLVSIHANAASTSRGYLRVPGTSTYYNNPFWAPFAADVYERLLELKLSRFGVIGSFNYTVIRQSDMPSILVEQAFMTHAKDEEKMADPQFRQDMAQKIFKGIVDYLRYMEK